MTSVVDQQSIGQSQVRRGLLITIPFPHIIHKLSTDLSGKLASFAFFFLLSHKRLSTSCDNLHKNSCSESPVKVLVAQGVSTSLFINNPLFHTCGQFLWITLCTVLMVDLTAFNSLWIILWISFRQLSTFTITKVRSFVIAKTNPNESNLSAFWNFFDRIHSFIH